MNSIDLNTKFKDIIIRFLFTKLTYEEFIKNTIYGLFYLDSSLINEIELLLNECSSNLTEENKYRIIIETGFKRPNHMMSLMYHTTMQTYEYPFYLDLISYFKYDISQYYSIEDLELVKLANQINEKDIRKQHRYIFKQYINRYINKEDLQILIDNNIKEEGDDIIDILSTINSLIKIIMIYLYGIKHISYIEKIQTSLNRYNKVTRCNEISINLGTGICEDISISDMFN